MSDGFFCPNCNGRLSLKSSEPGILYLICSLCGCRFQKIQGGELLIKKDKMESPYFVRQKQKGAA